MSSTFRLTFVPVAAAAMLLSACSSETTENTANDAAPTSTASGGDEPSNATTTAPAAEASAVFPLNLTQTSQSGVVVQLTSIQMLPAETVVGVKIVNNYSRSAALNRRSYLSGGNGAQLEMRAPDGNEYLKVAPTQTLTGELVFKGRPLEGSDAVLVLNEGYKDSEVQDTPPMTFQIPLVQLGYK
ncbi:hypothetical protein SH584_10340 [Sphingomonas sp. LY29]|uniref:hypothetical protein n=1 Tax=Sphingomonas sp. LY29 TaxID=3095341 RepID=UPI002D794583|nr:hypothetical protein [Sphingomonas sp. LY29]WRP25439.1 hypothetical protein SH584_10340 [Sphingomonas sp. LY29]